MENPPSSTLDPPLRWSKSGLIKSYGDPSGHLFRFGAFLPSLLPRDEEAMKAPYKGWLAARQKSAFESTEAKLRALESACVVSAAGTSCLDDADGEPAGESTV